MKSIVVVSACALAMASGLALAGAPGLSVAANALVAPALLAANVEHRNGAGNDMGITGPGADSEAGTRTATAGALAAPQPQAR